MSDDGDERRASGESIARWKELQFEPHLKIEVPRETFEVALERVGYEDVTPEGFAPHASGTDFDIFEDVLFDYYSPTFTWSVEGDEDGEDEWFPWSDADADDEE